MIALVLIVLICIFASEANSVQNEYALARDSVGEDLYTSLYMFVRSYDGVTLAGADVQGSILPSMRSYYTAATALDDAIVNAYGDVYKRQVKMVIIASPRSTRGLTPRISMRALNKSHSTEMSERRVSSKSV